MSFGDNTIRTLTQELKKSRGIGRTRPKLKRKDKPKDTDTSKPTHGISLSELETGFMYSSIHAKFNGDAESAEFIEKYENDKLLSFFNPPVFSLSEIEIELRYVIVDLVKDKSGKIIDILVDIRPEILRELQPHQINTLKMKINADSLRTTDEGEDAEE